MRGGRQVYGARRLGRRRSRLATGSPGNGRALREPHTLRQVSGRWLDRGPGKGAPPDHTSPAHTGLASPHPKARSSLAGLPQAVPLTGRQASPLRAHRPLRGEPRSEMAMSLPAWLPPPLVTWCLESECGSPLLLE